jgi:hypothetical protein
MLLLCLHTSVQHLVACAIEVTINTVYATLFIYYPLLEDVLFIVTCLASFEPSSGNVHMILRKLLYNVSFDLGSNYLS